MLVTSFRYVTGSFFHCEGKDTGRKITKNTALIMTGFATDGVAVIALAIIGLISFTSFAPHALSALPLSAKLTMVIGGTSCFFINCVYVFYRFKKLNREIQRDLERTKNQIVKDQDVILREASESTIHSSHAIERVTESIKTLENNLEKVNSAIHTLQIKVKNESTQGPWHEKLKKGLEIKAILENQLENNKRFRERIQTHAVEHLEAVEEIFSENKSVLESINRMQQSLS